MLPPALCTPSRTHLLHAILPPQVAALNARLATVSYNSAANTVDFGNAAIVARQVCTTSFLQPILMWYSAA